MLIGHAVNHGGNGNLDCLQQILTADHLWRWSMLWFYILRDKHPEYAKCSEYVALHLGYLGGCLPFIQLHVHGFYSRFRH